MKRFRFRLQRVLELRERVERERQVELGRIAMERARLEEALRRVQTSIRSAKGGLRASLGPEAADGMRRVDAAAVRMQSNAALFMQVRAQRLAIELAGVHTREEVARKALAEARRDRRALEVLRDRQRAAWKASIARREMADMDEMATMRAARRAG